MLLSAKQLEAAHHVADDRLTDEAIAQLLGISRRTLGNWKNRPPFIFRVEEIKEEASADCRHRTSNTARPGIKLCVWKL
jgi:hypothetical protein